MNNSIQEIYSFSLKKFYQIEVKTSVLSNLTVKKTHVTIKLRTGEKATTYAIP